MEGTLKSMAPVMVLLAITWTTLNRLAMINPLGTIINEDKITTTTAIIKTEKAETIMVLEQVDTGRTLELEQVAEMNTVPTVDVKPSEVESLMWAWGIEEETIAEPLAMRMEAKVSQVETITDPPTLTKRQNLTKAVARAIPVVMVEEDTAAVVPAMAVMPLAVVVVVRAAIPVVGEVEVTLRGTLVLKALTAVWTLAPTLEAVISQIGNRVKRCTLPLPNTRPKPTLLQEKLQDSQVKRKTL